METVVSATSWFAHIPEPPDWRVDWPALTAACPWLGPLCGCPQDPLYHGEGDVATHTRMACEALAALPGYRARPVEERRLLFVATLLHDIGKPACTRHEPDGHITSHGHSRRGSIDARAILWRLGAPFAVREQICAIIRYHQIPFHLFERPDMRRTVIELSQTAPAGLLALVAEADIRGRICADTERLLENVALFVEYCREQGCLEHPYRFAFDHARFRYFRRPDRDPAYPAFDDSRCQVTLLSGLPAAGKDHWLRHHGGDQPVISLDALRAELRISPEGPQAAVIDAARERARRLLRLGEGFIWNGTNLSRDLRTRVIGLAADYGARLRIVYLETTEPELLRRNRARPSPVPETVIDRLLTRWEPPDLTEAQTVEWQATSNSAGDSA